MNLGLDIDGVLTNIEAFQFHYGIPFFKKNYNRDIVNECGKNIKQLFDCTEEEERKFWSIYLFPYAIFDKVRAHAADYTKWAYENNHHIYIITSRVFTTKDTFMGKAMRFIVRGWLKRNGIRYDEIVFCDEDKLHAIKKYNICCMVEDDPDNIKALKDYTHVICMDNKCNAHIDDEGVKRCYNFSEVTEYMKEWEAHKRAEE